MYRFHVSISISQHQHANFTTRRCGPNSLNIWLMLLTKWGYVVCTHIHSTFYSFCNEFHENSLQWIHNWKGKQKNEWLNELQLMLLTKWRTYMVSTHVRTPSFNLHWSTPRGRFHYKEIWAQFTQHSLNIPIHFLMNSQLERWTTSEWLSELRLVLLTMWGQFVHMWHFYFHLLTNTWRIEKYYHTNFNFNISKIK
jgi:hypothetical protein